MEMIPDARPDRGLEAYLNKGRFVRSIGESVNELLERTGLSSRMKHREIYGVWEALAGGARARHTRIVSVRGGGVLEIEVDSAPLMHELEFQKHGFLKAIQAQVEKPFINRIVFRLGSFEQE